jgi:CDGSH-type Zn-finger protein
MVIKCNGASNTPVEWLIAEKYKTQQSYALCRCGHSNNKPFCDGTHFKINFNGSEDYDNVPFEQMAKTIDGPTLTLKDAEILCASARFCHRGQEQAIEAALNGSATLTAKDATLIEKFPLDHPIDGRSELAVWMVTLVERGTQQLVAKVAVDAQTGKVLFLTSPPSGQ